MHCHCHMKNALKKRTPTLTIFFFFWGGGWVATNRQSLLQLANGHLQCPLSLFRCISMILHARTQWDQARSTIFFHTNGWASWNMAISQPSWLAVETLKQVAGKPWEPKLEDLPRNLATATASIFACIYKKLNWADWGTRSGAPSLA